MKRRYNTKMVKEKIDLIREKIEGATFTSDIIVGFPGETDEDFKQTKEFLNSLDLLSFHIFSYSKRPGTLAAEMPDQIPEATKALREKELEELRSKMTDRVLDGYVGKELDVMVEEYKNGLGAFGHSMGFLEVAIPDAPNGLHGEICRTVCERHENGTVFAKIL
jgi:threonylcarbamoyladenosine tRNA methylthiotransferase MtaB